MPPTLHLVRHGEGFHNVGKGDHTLVDPELTPKGAEQCAALRAAFPYTDSLTRIVASPMRRALQTATQAFGRDELLPIVAMDMMQETSDAPNDTGSAVEVLQTQFGETVDLSRVSANWTDKNAGTFFDPEVVPVVERAKNTRAALKELAGDGDGHIVGVSHGGYLHFLTDDWEHISLKRRSTWSNCDYRSYHFVSEPDGGIALVETEESWRRRRGNDPRPTAEDQARWRENALRELQGHMKYDRSFH